MTGDAVRGRNVQLIFEANQDAEFWCGIYDQPLVENCKCRCFICTIIVQQYFKTGKSSHSFHTSVLHDPVKVTFVARTTRRRLPQTVTHTNQGKMW